VILVRSIPDPSTAGIYLTLLRGRIFLEILPYMVSLVNKVTAHSSDFCDICQQTSSENIKQDYVSNNILHTRYNK